MEPAYWKNQMNFLANSIYTQNVFSIILACSSLSIQSWRMCSWKYGLEDRWTGSVEKSLRSISDHPAAFIFWDRCGRRKVWKWLVSLSYNQLFNFLIIFLILGNLKKNSIYHVRRYPLSKNDHSKNICQIS